MMAEMPVTRPVSSLMGDSARTETKGNFGRRLASFTESFSLDYNARIFIAASVRGAFPQKGLLDNNDGLMNVG